ncbi:hypothetical protein J6590_065101 [Homalodisca vitripennis]|nr:hypothetical protein J6590_065101 [Homalodisca vitripennis]
MVRERLGRISLQWLSSYLSLPRSKAPVHYPRKEHGYNTRSRVNLRQTQHQSALAAGLPLNDGARVFWRLPDCLKSIQNKSELKLKLISS